MTPCRPNAGSSETLSVYNDESITVSHAIRSSAEGGVLSGSLPRQAVPPRYTCSPFGLCTTAKRAGQTLAMSHTSRDPGAACPLERGRRVARLVDLAQQHDILAAHDVQPQRRLTVQRAHDDALDRALQHQVGKLVEGPAAARSA